MTMYRPIRYSSLPALAAAAIVVLVAFASPSQAGILLPEPISFDAQDLEESLSGNADEGAGSAPQKSEPLPFHDDSDQPTNPLSLLKASLPTGSTSSTSTSSTSGGAPGTANAVCLPTATIAVTDDLALSQLAEDHGLSLPDPPGTDLFRPPQR